MKRIICGLMLAGAVRLHASEITIYNLTGTNWAGSSGSLVFPPGVTKIHKDVATMEVFTADTFWSHDSGIASYYWGLEFDLTIVVGPGVFNWGPTYLQPPHVATYNPPPVQIGTAAPAPFPYTP
jgi:hypothetical protein